MGCQSGMYHPSHEGLDRTARGAASIPAAQPGRAMVLAGLYHLCNHGADVILLGAISGNVAAQRLSAPLGFRLVRRICWGAWEDAQQRQAYGACMVRTHPLKAMTLATWLRSPRSVTMGSRSSVRSITRREESITYMLRAWCYSGNERLVAGF
jgi:hypothetical protein